MKKISSGKQVSMEETLLLNTDRGIDDAHPCASPLRGAEKLRV